MPTHAVLGLSAGLTEKQVSHIGDEPVPSEFYSEDQRVVVEYARASTLMRPITDDLYGRLLQFFSTQEIIELCMIVGFANLINRFHATFRTDLEPETETAAAASCRLRLPTIGST